MREALFAILGDLTGARVLDLYAGSGALAIEALSRGAASAVLVESGRAAQNAIRTNLERLELGAVATLLPVRVEVALKQLAVHAPFDLVLADPPWADAQAAVAELDKLAERELLAHGARFVLEHAARGAAILSRSLGVVDRRSWGDTAATIFERGAGLL